MIRVEPVTAFQTAHESLAVSLEDKLNALQTALPGWRLIAVLPGQPAAHFGFMNFLAVFARVEAG